MGSVERPGRQTKYLCYRFLVDKKFEDALTAWLFHLGFEGTEDTDKGVTAYIPDINAEGINEKLSELGLSIPFSFDIESIADQNWNKVWESNFQPVIIGGRCGIRASFHPPFNQLDFEIVINPKMSFGTGHHDTTAMMIELMMDTEFTNKKILDFGCGTGVLSILANKLGAAHVDAIDNDSWSFENANENALLNQCQAISIYLGELENQPQNQYDIILANINKTVLLQYAQTIDEMLKPEGNFFCSGFLSGDKDDLIHAFGKFGLKKTENLEKNNWVCLKMKKPAGK